MGGAVVAGAVDVGAGVDCAGVGGGGDDALGAADADGEGDGATAGPPSCERMSAKAMAATTAIAPDMTSPEPASASPSPRRRSGGGASGRVPSPGWPRRWVSSLTSPRYPPKRSGSQSRPSSSGGPM